MGSTLCYRGVLSMRKKLPDLPEWTGAKVDPSKHFGFVYRLMDLTDGSFYIGKKNIWIKKSNAKGCKSAVAAPQAKRWKPTCWKESDWKTYNGSSKYWLQHLYDNTDHKYERRVIVCCQTKGVLHFAELVAIILSGSMTSPLGFNYACPNIKYRVDPTLWSQLQIDTPFTGWFY